tara:strand:- start:1684 stop:2379 length:696 start_codon:yes stop_codon:yes gene_type:complete
MNKKIKIHDLGLKGYQETYDYQLSLFNEIIERKISNRKNKQELETKNHLVFVEHKNVYTLGKSGNLKNLLISEENLKKNKIEFHKTNRGGDITYHGPGQVVCYPIIDLDNFFTDINRYLRSLEETVILTLKDYNIVGQRSDKETGVWIDPKSLNPRKICAMGVKASRWVTMHGLALNVNTNLDFFKNIIPCGIENKFITSISKECKNPVDLMLVKKKIIKNFLNVFSAELN